MRGLVSFVGGYTVLIAARQIDLRDLAPDAESRRRSPIASATAGIYPETAQAAKPGRKRLLEPHEESPGPELTTMRMAGELKVEACRFGCERRPRLVRE